MTQNTTKNKKRKLEESQEEAVSFPPPFTSKTLEQRLRKGIMVQSGGQKGSLTRCVQKYAVLTATANINNEASKQEQLREFLQELQLYRMELTRSVLLQRNLAKEIETNVKVEEALEEEMEKTKSKVHECQQQAKRAKQVQSCFMEYEALSQLANTCLSNDETIHSTRQLKSEITRVKQEIALNQREEVQLDSILQVRKSQFHLLIQCMLDLKRSLGDDDDDNDDDETKKGNDEEATAAVTMEVEEDAAMDNDNLYGDLG